MIEDWNDLKVFLTLAEEGQLTAAAKKLHVSHPTIARRVKALEESVSARLFDRLPDRFVLTPAIAVLLGQVPALSQHRQVFVASDGVSQGAVRTLRHVLGDAGLHPMAGHDQGAGVGAEAAGHRREQ